MVFFRFVGYSAVFWVVLFMVNVAVQIAGGPSLSGLYVVVAMIGMPLNVIMLAIVGLIRFVVLVGKAS